MYDYEKEKEKERKKEIEGDRKGESKSIFKNKIFLLLTFLHFQHFSNNSNFFTEFEFSKTFHTFQQTSTLFTFVYLCLPLFKWRIYAQILCLFSHIPYSNSIFVFLPFSLYSKCLYGQTLQIIGKNHIWSHLLTFTPDWINVLNEFLSNILWHMFWVPTMVGFAQYH